MKRDFLKEQGLEDEQINAIMAEHGKTVNAIKEQADKADSLESQIDDYKNQIKERDEQLKELQESAKGNEELENRIKELQTANDETKKEYEQKLAETQKRSKLELAIKDAGAHDPEDVISKLDLDTIKLNDGKLQGFDEQLSNIKENKGYLFKSEEEEKPAGLKGRNPQHSDPNKQNKGITKDQFNQMSYTERLNLYQEQPDVYKQLAE